MIYAAFSDLNAQFGEQEVLAITDRDGDGVADTTVVNMALQRASNTIDAYLSPRYPLPLTAVPDQLVELCCDIARYRLVGAEASETDAIRTRYKDSLKTLELIRDGKIDIGLSLAGQTPADSASVQVTGGGRIFSQTSLEDY